MASDYYKRKTFTRAEGILRTCLIPDYRYAWGGKGNSMLVFFLPTNVEETTLQKVLEYMVKAFRAAKCIIGPSAPNREPVTGNPNKFTRTIVIRFKAKEAK